MTTMLLLWACPTLSLFSVLRNIARPFLFFFQSATQHDTASVMAVIQLWTYTVVAYEQTVFFHHQMFHTCGN